MYSTETRLDVGGGGEYEVKENGTRTASNFFTGLAWESGDDFGSETSFIEAAGCYEYFPGAHNVLGQDALGSGTLAGQPQKTVSQSDLSSSRGSED